jgi:endonuclease YncB( thermonuclease family)
MVRFKLLMSPTLLMRWFTKILDWTVPGQARSSFWSIGLGVLLVVWILPACASEAIATNGQTLIIDSRVVRLAGIDAPQTDQTCLDGHRAVWNCGIAARDALRAHINDRKIRCDDTGPDPQRQNRRLSVCWIEGEANSINQWLAREGWALSAPGTTRFKADENDARFAHKGLWKGCFVAPDMLRRWSRNVARMLGSSCPPSEDWDTLKTLFPDRPPMPVGCSIKGKIAARALATGDRGVYHTNICRSYRRTQNPDRWFCTEQEAKAEGFRKSYTC